MARHQRKHYRRSQQNRFPGLYKLISAVIILGAVVGGCIVFFRVQNVVVEGESRYTHQEIAEASGILQGDNIFLFNKYDVMDGILRELSYIEEVSIHRQYPSTVVITVRDTEIAAAVKDAEQGIWWQISSAGKVLERAEDPGAYPLVTGIAPLAPSEGTALSVDESQRLRLEALKGLLSALEDMDMIFHVGNIDLSNPSAVVFIYDDRLTVRMPLDGNFEYQVSMLAGIMEEYIAVYWSEGDTGTLDMTNSDGQPHLKKDVA